MRKEISEQELIERYGDKVLQFEYWYKNEFSYVGYGVTIQGSVVFGDADLPYKMTVKELVDAFDLYSFWAKDEFFRKSE